MSNSQNDLTPNLNISNPLSDFDFSRLPGDYSLADYQYEIIVKEISDFEKNLDNDHEIALKLCNFGQSILLNVTEISYHNPNLMFFYGYVNDNYTQLIQHTSQINFLLMAVPKSNPKEPPRRIGFTCENKDED